MSEKARDDSCCVCHVALHSISVPVYSLSPFKKKKSDYSEFECEFVCLCTGLSAYTVCVGWFGLSLLTLISGITCVFYMVTIVTAILQVGHI